MKEDIGTIISRGFSTWTRNLVICVPFILEILVTVLLSMLAAVLFVMILVMPIVSGSNMNPEQLSPEAIMAILESLFSANLLILLAFGIIFLLFYTLVQSFFAAGAIGMSTEALQKGDTGIGDLASYGSENFFNLFLLKVMVSLLVLAGVVFLIPGFLSIGDIGNLVNNPQSALASTSLLAFGLILWLLYFIVLSIILIFVEYALVTDHLDPVSAIEKGVSFFMANKFPALVLWVLLIGISVLFVIIGEVFSYSDILAQIWTYVDFVLTVLVVRPLITIWWTRFYLNRNDRKLYSFDEYTLDN